MTTEAKSGPPAQGQTAEAKPPALPEAARVEIPAGHSDRGPVTDWAKPWWGECGPGLRPEQKQSEARECQSLADTR